MSPLSLCVLSLMMVKKNALNSLQLAAFHGTIEVTQLVLSMDPSPANQQEALCAAHYDHESFIRAVSALDLVAC